MRVVGALVAAVAAFAATLSGTAAASAGPGTSGEVPITSSAPSGTVTSLASGQDTSCAAVGGAAWCWGSNRWSQLGDGTTRHSSVPVAVTTAGTPLAGATVTQVAVGEGVGCALTSAGAVSCWGTDAFSSTGNASSPASAVPVAVSTAGPLNGKVVEQIGALRWHVCALTTDDVIACWGYNGSGQIGDGTTTKRNVPTAVDLAGSPLAGKDIASIDVGYANTCALATDGTLGCWGDNAAGQLGNGTATASKTPVSPTIAGSALDGKTPVQVSVGLSHTCVRNSDASLACWGSGANGGLGRGSTTSASIPVPVTTTGTALEGKTPVDIDTGGYRTCARASDGALACWGYNTSGQVGDGTTTNRTTAVAVAVAGTSLHGKPVTKLGLGLYTGCAAAGRSVACWGTNRYGALGNGTSAVSTVPGPAVGGSLAGATLAEVDGNLSSACARTTAGVVSCWGQDDYNQVGVPGSAMVRSPVAVPVAGTPLASSPAVDIDVGGIHACAVSADGAVTCWGSNGSKQLGRAALVSTPGAVETSGSAIEGKTVVQVEAGAAFTCARTSDGLVACWGMNAGGQLGIGTTGASTPVPTALATAGTPLAGKTIVDLAVGDNASCALASDSTVACWGDNGFGTLGNGTTTGSSSVPTAITKAGTPLLGKTITDIELGESDTACVVTSVGGSACWGEGSYGSIGDGQSDHATVPAAPTVAGTALEGKTIVQADPGYVHVCWRASDSTLACAGSNTAGSLGNGGDSTDRSVPDAVATAGTPLAGASVAQLASIGYGTCARTTGSVLSCWGHNWYGQLGTGALDHSPTPVDATGFEADATVPDPPTIGTATAGDAQVTVTWSAPSTDGGSPITGYVVTPSIGGVVQAPVASPGTGTSKTVTGLTNGTTYTFTVAAVNDVGTGAASAASAAATPRAPYSPFASWGALVDRLYLDLTAVAPSASARSSWVSQLTSGAKRPGDLVAALRVTPDNTAKIDATVRLYRALLGRAPDAGGLRFWVNRRRSGSWTLNRMATAFSSSSEFQRKYGSLTNKQFVTQIYTDVLGREADPGGVAYWTGKLDAGQRTRGTVMVGFSESNEYKRKQVENTDVAVAYIFLLGRAATSGETTDWVTRQKGGTPLATLAGELLASAAYRSHIVG